MILSYYLENLHDWAGELEGTKPKRLTHKMEVGGRAESRQEPQLQRVIGTTANPNPTIIQSIYSTV